MIRYIFTMWKLQTFEKGQVRKHLRNKINEDDDGVKSSFIISIIQQAHKGMKLANFTR